MWSSGTVSHNKREVTWQGDWVGLNPWTVVRETENPIRTIPVLTLQKASVATWSLVVLGACWHSGTRLQLMRNCFFAFFNHDSTKWEIDKFSLFPFEPMHKNFLWEWRDELIVHPPHSLLPSWGESESSRAAHQTSLTNLSLKTFVWLIDGNAHWRK